MVRRRSGGRCECTGQCGKHKGRCTARHGAFGGWAAPGRFVPYKAIERALSRSGTYLADKLLTIVLTVMHLDHTPENNDPANLLEACQRCHNCYDAPHRAQTRRRHKAAKDLFA